MCRFCGERVPVSELDLPMTFREDPPRGSRPRQFVVIGAHWLLHRCEIMEEVESVSDPVHPVAVYQAQGMVSAQGDHSLDAALALMLNTADAADVSLEQLAVNIIDGTVRFDPPA